MGSGSLGVGRQDRALFELGMYSHILAMYVYTDYCPNKQPSRNANGNTQMSVAGKWTAIPFLPIGHT